MGSSAPRFSPGSRPCSRMSAKQDPGVSAFLPENQGPGPRTSEETDGIFQPSNRHWYQKIENEGRVALRRTSLCGAGSLKGGVGGETAPKISPLSTNYILDIVSGNGGF